MVDLSLNVGMSCGPVVDLFCGAREALWRRRAILWRYVTDVPSPCSTPRGFFVLRCLADGGGRSWFWGRQAAGRPGESLGIAWFVDQARRSGESSAAVVGGVHSFHLRSRASM